MYLDHYRCFDNIQIHKDISIEAEIRINRSNKIISNCTTYAESLVLLLVNQKLSHLLPSSPMENSRQHDMVLQTDLIRHMP